jgi:hypothetical protein
VTAASKPSQFDWWAGVWIPIISGAVTLVVAVASLIIALVALRIARATMLDARRVRRMKRAAELTALTGQTANDIWRGNFDEAWNRVRDHNAELALASDKQPASIVVQLMYWALYAMQHRPDRQLREDIATEILFEIESAIAKYAADDSGTWTMTKRTINNLRQRPRISPDPTS